jgi:hypothetical protein
MQINSSGRISPGLNANGEVLARYLTVAQFANASLYLASRSAGGRGMNIFNDFGNLKWQGDSEGVCHTLAGNGYFTYFRNDGSAGNGACDFFSNFGSAGRNILRINVEGSVNNINGVYGAGLSDIRVKEHIEDARSYLDDFCKLRVVKYAYKDDHVDKANMLGFIAQDVVKIFPNLVWLDPKDGIYKNLKLSIIHTIAVKVLQEVAEKTKTLETKVADLESKNSDLETRLARLEKLLLEKNVPEV